ncbi:hypothetical protein Tco_0848720 [Tanacetum coccineum]
MCEAKTNRVFQIEVKTNISKTATVKTVDNEEQEITAIVDGKEFTITEASVRRHLQLADVEGISVLLTTEIFDQLSLMGYQQRVKVQDIPINPQPPPSTAQPTNEEPIPTIVSSSRQKTQTPRQALKEVTELPQTSEPIPNVPDKVVYEEWDDRVGRATTTVASLDAVHASGNITKTQPTAIPNVPLSQEIGTGGSPRCQEAMGGSIAQTKSKKLAQRIQAKERENTLKLKKQDCLQNLSTREKRYFAQQRAEERRNKPLTQAQQRTYMSNYIKHMGSHTLQQLKRLSFDELKNLSEVTMRRVGAFVPIETKIRREVPELAPEKPAEESKEKEDDELSQEELQQLMIIVPEEGMNVEAMQTKYPIINWEVYIKIQECTGKSSGDDLVKLWSLVQERFNSTDPTEDKEIELWVELKRLFEPDVDDELWKSYKHVHDITWRLYDTCGVHHVFIKDEIDIYMLVENEYPLSRGVLTQMLAAKLLVEQNNKMSKELLRKIFMMAERPRR